MSLLEKLDKVDELNKQIEQLQEKRDNAIDDFTSELYAFFEKVDVPDSEVNKYVHMSLRTHASYDIPITSRQAYKETIADIRQVLHVMNMYPEDFWIEVSEDKIHLGGEGCFYHEWERDSASFPRKWIDKSVDDFKEMLTQMRDAAEKEQEEAEKKMEAIKEEANRRRYEELKAKYEGKSEPAHYVVDNGVALL